MDDILLVTVDCWRHDAPGWMPTFRKTVSSWHQRDILTASGATNGAFPAILASSYEFNVYDEDGAVNDDVHSLPSVLSEAGYETAGYVASNPFLGKWSSHFDTFWNDGMRADGTGNTDSRTFLGKIKRALMFQPRVTDEAVLERAEQWWTATDSPRFLWVHLMSPHAPYYPGLSRALDVGLLRSYLSIIGYARRRGDVPDWLARHIRELHRQSVKSLDEPLSDFLHTIGTDTATVVTADHGEEFDHGSFDHARLYDETTRCPYFTNRETLCPTTDAIRQIDIAPTICTAAGTDTPPEWEGTTPDYDSVPVQPMMTRSNKSDSVWVGVHDDRRKLIKTIDQTGGNRERELYDLERDPREQMPIDELPNKTELDEILSDFTDRSGFDQTLESDISPGINKNVSNRLDKLGYK